MNRRHDLWNLREEIILEAEKLMIDNPDSNPSEIAQKVYSRFSRMYTHLSILDMVTAWVRGLATSTAEETKQIIEFDVGSDGVAR